WAGQPIRIVDKTEFPGVQTNVVLTDISYDDLGRESQVQKKIYDSFLNNNITSTPWTIVSKTTYDALGQIQKVELGKKKDPATGNYTTEPLEHLNYAYSVRGELLSINRKLLEGSAGTMPAMSANGNYFGMELGYDKNTAIASGASYTGLRYDGAIAGVVWKTRGDQAGRMYNYTYDDANRLTAAAFKQNAQGATDWNNSTFNFSESVGQYDLNGNIKTLSRNGLTTNSSPVIDNLTYSYNSYENKPYKIADAGIATTNMNLGDFIDGSNTGDDYNYNNGNGSLTADLNKGISAITYWSTTEKPQIITTTKGSINYIYNDDGTKLRKVYVENPSAANGNKTITVTTNYVGSLVFESRDIQPDDPQRPDYTNKLLFTAFAEGRIRALYNNGASSNTLTGFAYDYFVKDHLGSTRMILTDEVKVIYYPAATLEGTYSASGTTQSNSMVNFEKQFYNIDYTKTKLETAIPSWATESTSNTKLYYNNNGIPNTSYPAGSTPVQTDGSTRLYELNATSNKTGLEFMIKVMAGDKVSIFGKSYYLNTSTINNSNSTALDLITLMTNLLAVPGNPAGSKGLSAAQLNSTNSGLIPSSFFRGGNNEASTTVPKAYINYIFFDEQFKYTGGNFSRVGSSGTVKDHFNDAAMQEVAVPKNGYLFVYVSNESNMPVYFDNLQVVHKPGPILEESHYYPYGLKIAGISSKAFGVINNPFQFQGDYSSLDEHTGWNDFELRSYDAQVGRWTTADPYDQFGSPFVGMGGDPVNSIDEDGGWSAGLTGSLIGAAAVGVTSYLIARNNGGSDLESFGAGLGGAVLGAGIGYAIGETLFPEIGYEASFLNNGAAFYKGLFGGTPGDLVKVYNGVSGPNAVAATVPDIWGWAGTISFPNINLPSLDLIKWVDGFKYLPWQIIDVQTLATVGIATQNDQIMIRNVQVTPSGQFYIPDNVNVTDQGAVTIPTVPRGDKRRTNLVIEGSGDTPGRFARTFTTQQNGSNYSVTINQTAQSGVGTNYISQKQRRGYKATESRVQIITSRKIRRAIKRLKIFGIKVPFIKR
ncbi:MAG: RHS repeat-associated core domain-containing protein, partial [Agriterribacter sp.]